MQKDGRVLYLTATKNENQYWNIPIANTTCLLLEIGTSITQAAMRMLASAGVCRFLWWWGDSFTYGQEVPFGKKKLFADGLDKRSRFE